MDAVLSTVHGLSRELQNSSIDNAAAFGLIQACKTALIKYHSDESWEEILEQTNKLCDMMGVAPQRFTENIEVFRVTSVFNPCHKETFLNEKLMYILDDYYQTAGIDKQLLESEIRTDKTLIDCQHKNQTPNCFTTFYMPCPGPHMFAPNQNLK
ncbi:hypothetical protein HELRODRAFT_177503 [Helobdella robusta]|uniref:Uncharacterized protein n=1 Tax=Helobdella robusta TaxID=6412 RepID=T1FBT5_HELRO|nr:hypothetical protein HELRODRAFT_177503 [Helobdella robusta]ESN97867.1 hypothetical protein HELRODRAFT_177503 [Helobdella robusta]